MAIFDLSLLSGLGAILGILVDALWLFALTQGSAPSLFSLSLLSPAARASFLHFQTWFNANPLHLPCTGYMKKVYKIRNREKLIQI